MSTITSEPRSASTGRCCSASSKPGLPAATASAPMPSPPPPSPTTSRPRSRPPAASPMPPRSSPMRSSMARRSSATISRGQVHRWVQDKTKVIDRWVAAGKMQPVAAPHLFFVLWAATQTYADFECQMRAVLKRRRLEPADYAAGSELITQMVLGACGISLEQRLRSKLRAIAPPPLPSFRRKPESRGHGTRSIQGASSAANTAFRSVTAQPYTSLAALDSGFRRNDGCLYGASSAHFPTPASSAAHAAPL